MNRARLSVSDARRVAVDDRGSASIWVLACAALVVLIALAFTGWDTATLARHRAEAAADLAALAAAAQIGIGDDPCGAARKIATANGAQLGTCTVAVDATGRSGTVHVVASVIAGLPWGELMTMRADAWAERAKPSG